MRIYQLAPEPNSLGQAYVIKTKNNKIIVIDGGIDGVGRDAPVYMPSAIRAILGLNEGDFFEVEAWFLSHAHSDHFYELAKMLCSYDGSYKIKNFYFDFPDYSVVPCTEKITDKKFFDALALGLKKYGSFNKNGVSFPSLNSAVINADAVDRGLSFTVDGVVIDVLQTWTHTLREDINNDSIVLRASEGGRSALFLNDLGRLAGERLLEKYGEKLKSTAVQMAHHGQKGVGKEVYDAVNASVRLWPIPIWVWERTDLFATGETRAWLNGGVDYTVPMQADVASCYYTKYPTNIASVSAWSEVVEHMAIEL